MKLEEIVDEMKRLEPKVSKLIECGKLIDQLNVAWDFLVEDVVAIRRGWQEETCNLERHLTQVKEILQKLEKRLKAVEEA